MSEEELDDVVIRIITWTLRGFVLLVFVVALTVLFLAIRHANQ